MRERQLDPQAYLQDHLEPPSEWNKAAHQAYLAASLIRPEYRHVYDDAGEFSERVGDRTIEFSTARLDEPFIARLRQIAKDQGRSWLTDRMLKGRVPVHLIRHFKLTNHATGAVIEIGGDQAAPGKRPMIFLRDDQSAADQENFTP